MTGAPLRVLGRVRLSRDTDASTSVERQIEHIEDWARRENAEIVGWAKDVDVSGKVDPFKTPDLGPWLRPPKMNEWDVMVAWKLDRVSRGGPRVMSRLIEWLEDHGKDLVTTHDNIDTRARGIANEILLTFTSAFAREERDAISARQIDSQKKLREVGRFRGGPIPYGYQKVKRGDAWYLEIHEGNAAVFRELVDMYLGGMSLGGIAAVMNDRGAPTPQKRRAGDGKWRSGTIIQMFKSRTALGETVYKGRVVRGDNGRPVMRAPELISPERFERLQERLRNARKQPVGSFSGKKKLLLDILFCAICGRKMYYVKGSGTRNYWRCSGATHAVPGEAKCVGRTIPAERIESQVIRWVLATVGDEPVKEEQFFPAEGVGAALKDAEDAIAGIRKERYAGFYDGDEDSYMTTLGAMIARRNELRAMPSKPARYEMVETGGTWAEAMESAKTPEDKRAVLLKLGMKIDATRDDRGEITATIITKLDVLRTTIPDALAGPVAVPVLDWDGYPAVLVDGEYVPADPAPVTT